MPQGQLTRAVADALKAAQIQPRDRAAVQLVRRYAQLLDEARGREDEVEVYKDLGPRLLAALTALGLTPAGRGVKGGERGERPGIGKLVELRNRRSQPPR